jgi:hypothetical protein
MTDIFDRVKESEKVFSQIVKAERDFLNTKYKKTVVEAYREFDAGDHQIAKQLLDKLPTEQEMLSELIEKLKGKSVYRTLKKIDEGKETDENAILKGLFSLGTHVLIECQQGKEEFRMLLPFIYKRIGEELFK